MMKRIDRLPLSSIQLGQPTLSPVKPHIKILKQKLPADFFNKKLGVCSATSVVRSIELRPPATSSFARKNIKEQSPMRQAFTARNYHENKDQDLIMGVLKSAREIKRVFRRHSIQLQQGSINKKKTQGIDLQLPPLLLKKGVTMAL